MLYLSGNKWEVYVGLPQEVVVSKLIDALNSLRCSYKKGKKPPIFMYDSTHEQVVFEVSELEISLVYVSADPLTRFFSTFFGTQKNFTGITYLSASVPGPGARARLKEILRAFYNETEQSPWHISWHPRFRYAFLLQLFNKWRWQRMLG
ncbi:MAG: hypothetical protein ACOY40_10865 [Bacillota bacterium]